MTDMDHSHRITDIAVLASLYGPPPAPAVVKEVDYLHPAYRPFIEASPFMVLATGGPAGLDASPRGDRAGFVIVEDEKTLLIPDRPGNNRFDSLRNILEDPRVALFFLIPGIGETLRINGRASLSVDPNLVSRFVVNGKPPRVVIVVEVETVFFQCSKAVVRADLWNPAKHLERSALPSTGTLLAVVSKGSVDAGDYDRALPERVRTMLY
jgi:PPOX class probable FMN-dependent enzyme